MWRRWVVVAETGQHGWRIGRTSYWVVSKHWTQTGAQRRKAVLIALNSYRDIPLYVMPRRDAEVLPGVTW